MTNESISEPKHSISRSNGIQSTRSMTCCICLENIVATRKQFGIQNNCDHFFCFECLSTWRRMNDKEIGRRCPLCRTRSTFIAPSWRCFTDTDDKQALIGAHKLRLKTKPCRTFLQYSSCRYGRRCYYSHRYLSDGHNQNLLFDFQYLTSENNHESSERVTYHSHRYRPY
ncbi:unnamed protein product [Adineta ricciae]|uniref:RING-type E3 ubiquitin transferase n=1 Tax=Adineta ricciae TaxID=249248 RepID=A0A814XVB1_ADIRI|nr:unnamed protein product [Adineta ricciae]